MFVVEVFDFEVFVIGFNILGVNGMYFGLDGLFYVVLVIGFDLIVFNLESG